MKKVLAMLLCLALIVGCLAGCGDGNKGTTSSGTTSTATPAENGGEAGGETGGETGDVSTGPADTSEHYSFTVYYNYTGWSKVFGQDGWSKYLSDKFNIDINWYGPDSDPMAKLNLMVSSDDLPESVVMDRGPDFQKICRGGYLYDLQQFMYPGNTFERDIAASTRELLKVDGGLYGVPNWARKGATGGNYQWIINTAAYEAVGEPPLETFEDLHQFALKIKEAGVKTYAGEDMYPFYCTNTENAYYVYQPFYRSMGMPNIVASYFTQEDGKIQYCLESENFVQALRDANQWFNEGLFTAEVFTENSDQFKAKLTTGRPGLLWYDFSQDSYDHFRPVYQKDSGYSYEVLGSPTWKSENPMFPAYDGVDIVYGDEAGTVGWNMNTVTKKATDPQRIFDLWTYMITPEGSVGMMYGPEDGGMIDHVDYSGDLPVVYLVAPESEIDPAVKDAAGSWMWSQPAQSDYVDGIKFAVNDTAPEDQKDWVVNIQAHMCSFNAENPRIGQKFPTDENTNIDTGIDPTGELGAPYQSLKDQSKAQLPKIIMAKDEAEFNKLVEDLLAYVKSNGRSDDICAVMQAQHDENVKAQGFSAYDPAYDLYKVNK